MDPDRSVEEISGDDSESTSLSYEDNRWRKLTEVEEKEIDDKLGLVKIAIELKRETLQALEERSKKRGVSVQAIIKKAVEYAITPINLNR